MKKVFYLLTVIGLIFTGCNPLEDIHNEIDSIADPIVGNVEFTMTSDDYADVDTSTDDDAYENYENFSTVDDAKDKIASLLLGKYPYWGEGSAANVTFNLYKPLSIANEEVYTVSAQDYDDLGYNYGNFSNEDDFQVFLPFKYPDAQRGDLVELTYQWWAPGVETRTDKFILLDVWEKTSQFTNDDYTAMGQNYPNFSDEEDAIFRIGIYLETLYPYAQAGDEIVTLYKFYDNGVEDVIAPFTFDGEKWHAVGSVVEESIKFGFKNGVWVPDNTIRYTLVGDDYNYISAQLISEPGFEGPAENIGNYGSFDIRETSSNYWDNDMILIALDVLLDNLDPSAEEGQKYILTYKIYDGSVGNNEKSLIKESGEWIINTEE